MPDEAAAGAPLATVIHVRDMRPGDIYIGRASPALHLAASKWASGYEVGPRITRARANQMYEIAIRDLIDIYPDKYNLDELEGHRLAHWCAPHSCHGDVLVKLLAERRAWSHRRTS